VYNSRAAITALIKQIGAVQIDTLQMVQRSHYLAVWSRLGNYDPAVFDSLIYAPEERRLFEGWMHAACILPLEDYRYQRTHQQQAIENGSAWFGEWLQQPGNRELLEMVRRRLQQEGPLRSQDFEYEGPKRGSWWDWKPAKVALEHLHTFGEAMVTDRVNFQRVYDLTERVLPAWVDRSVPEVRERDRYWIELGARALGICSPNQTGDYSFRKKAAARPVIRELLGDGTLKPVQARLADGEIHDLVVHWQLFPLLERIADGQIRAERTTFLSPFDSLFWANQRDQDFWGFRQVLEAYKPAPQREWGYYCLPILHREQLVGRFDPKLERKDGLLRLKALYLEPGQSATQELVEEVAQAMREFMDFHRANDLVIEHSEPGDFGSRLLDSLSSISG